MKAATIRDVARRAEVSVASVSRVLSGTGPVTDYTRQKVEAAVAELAYVPHSGARSLSTSRTQVIGVILPDLFGEFFSELIRGMDLAARAGGYHLIVSSTHGDADEAAAVIRSMRGRVDGLAVLSPHVDDAGLAESLASAVPVLVMNGGEGGSRPSIVVDNHAGAVEAVRHLAAGGRRRIAFIAGPQDNSEAAARRSGYLAAMAQAGLEPQIADGDFSQSAGHTACLELISRAPRPDAVFAANDMMAVGALLALQETGLRCPEDVAVVGFDDVPIAALMRPSLTTMKIDIAGIGRRALERLIDLIRNRADADAAQEVVRPVLVERQSTRPHHKTANHPAAAGLTPGFATIDS
ncbi:LacI family transcriptional regulator [Brevundimonas sp. S30B]|uniref:LacI family DNA-binding transcriptional regulator n=1 Tax=unclassified Brevundimonas TaxID=2622653 RepID=UPI001072C254|nr:MULTISPECIES: LacI family DNA-binding transcriptional regulator [unclassified Brevundimonas]QBX37557.1 LacI family transcriptional regulator [Brevundimonas sp. MF30-B]TFW03650.1 LacI family transcriptional regulator [Brevundimonas sp. S30B]